MTEDLSHTPSVRELVCKILVARTIIMSLIAAPPMHDRDKFKPYYQPYWNEPLSERELEDLQGLHKSLTKLGDSLTNYEDWVRCMEFAATLLEHTYRPFLAVIYPKGGLDAVPEDIREYAASSSKWLLAAINAVQGARYDLECLPQALLEHWAKTR